MLNFLTNTLTANQTYNSRFSLSKRTIFEKSSPKRRFRSNLANVLIYKKVVSSKDGYHNVISNEILVDSIYQFGRLKTTYHRNGKDIWLIMVSHYSNKYYSYLVSQDTIILKSVSQLGPEIDPFKEGFFLQAAFSTKNDMMAFNSLVGLMLYDFDDETGELSNYRNYPIPSVGAYSGQCFSPSDRYVYAGNGERIYQIDITSDPDDPEIYDYGYQFITGANGWPISVGNMMTGPDCRIYISAGSATNYMHVVHYPDRQGADAELEKHIPLPMRMKQHFPQVPNLFPTCDSSISWGIHTSVLEPTDPQDPIVMYPNPATTEVQLTLPLTSSGRLTVYNMMGNPIIEMDKSPGIGNLHIDTTEWYSGSYVVVYESKDGSYRGMLQKI